MSSPPPPPGHLSKRGEGYLEEPEFMQMFRKYLWANPFDPVSNPEGCMNLAAAETVMVADLVEARLNRLRETLPLPASSFAYDRFAGNMSFCRSLAAFFDRFMLQGKAEGKGKGEGANPEGFVVTNGGGTALEALASCLCDEGDLIVVPSPAYHGLPNDFEKRFGAKLLPFMLSFDEAGMDYTADLEALTALCDHVEASGRRVRALVHLNPHNPTGKVFSEAETEALVRWCVGRGVHLISDEVYALSCFRPREDRPFVSALAVSRRLEQREGLAACRTFVHLVYSFSKDFGLNGFRAAAVYTDNKQLFAALDACSYFLSIPSVAQLLLARFLEDHAFLLGLFQTNAKRSRALYEKCVGVLAGHKVRAFPSEAGTFIWIDLMGALRTSPLGRPLERMDPRKQEEYVWELMLKRGVCILPSYVFQPAPCGWFRICFTTMQEKYVLEGIDRIIDALFRPQPRM